MFEETSLFGFDMAPQRNRRVLVAATYGGVLALALVPVVAFNFPRIMNFHLNLQLLLIFIVGRSIFGRLVPPALWMTKETKLARPMTLGIAPTVLDDEPQPDEREIAVRNGAFFSAYKGMVVAAFIVLNVVVMCLGMHTPLSTVCGVELMLLFTVVLFTLPQAVLLWMEPDLPEDLSAAD